MSFNLVTFHLSSIFLRPHHYVGHELGPIHGIKFHPHEIQSQLKLFSKLIPHEFSIFQRISDMNLTIEW